MTHHPHFVQAKIIDKQMVEDKEVRIPAHQYIHKLVVSSPNNFHPQALHDKDIKTKTIPYA